MPVLGRPEPTAKKIKGLEYDVTSVVTDSNVTLVVPPTPPVAKCRVFSRDDYAERGPSFPAKTSSSSLAGWGGGLGHAVGYGVSSLFPHAMADVAQAPLTGATKRSDVADRVDGPDSTVTTKVFTQRVIGELEQMKLRRKEEDLRARPAPTAAAVAAHWGMTENGVELALGQFGAAGREERLKRLAGVPTSRVRCSGEAPSLTDWRRSEREYVDPMEPVPSFRRKLDVDKPLPLWAAGGVDINALFSAVATVDGMLGGDILLKKVRSTSEAIGVDGAYAYARPGKASRSSPPSGIEALVYPECAECLSDLGRDFHWNVSNPSCCTRMLTADVPLAVQASLGEYLGPVLNHRRILEELPNWLDQRIAQDIEYGLHFERDLNPGIVVAGMNKSARPHLRSLYDGIVKQGAQHEVLVCEGITYFPSYFYGFGASSPNWKNKWRLTSDLRLHDADTDWRFGMSLNDQCVKEDYDIPRWVVLRDVLREGADMFSLWRELASAHPECEHALRPFSFAEDGKSYFHRFGMTRKSRLAQGMVIPTPGTGPDEKPLPPKFVSANVLLFGSRPGPWWSQRFSCVLVALIRKRQWAFEEELLRLSGKGDEEALRNMPAHLAELVRERSAGGGSIKLPTSTCMYIDDILSRCLGPLRAMVGLLCTWDEMERMGVPPGLEEDKTSSKAQMGEAIEFLGVLCDWEAGKAQVSESKTRVLLRWLRRIAGRTWIHLAEFESLWGTAGNVAMFLPGVRRALGHGYKAKSSKHYVIDSDFGQIVRVQGWMRDAISKILEALQKGGGEPFYEASPGEAEEEVIQSVTDAARTVSEKVFSGMGGVILHGTSAVMWHRRFTIEELRILPIHVLELVGSLTGLHLIRYFRRWAGLGATGPSRCLERIDNMSVVDAIGKGVAKDIRLIQLLSLREKSLEDQQLTSEAAWIWTKSIEQLGDAMSRGDFESVRKDLRGRGFERIVHWDLGGESEGLIPDYEELKAYLFKLSDEHEAMKGSEYVSRSRWRKSSRRAKRKGGPSKAN